VTLDCKTMYSVVRLPVLSWVQVKPCSRYFIPDSVGSQQQGPERFAIEFCSFNQAVSNNSTGRVQDASNNTCRQEAPFHTAKLQCCEPGASESDFRYANLHCNYPDVTDAAACNATPRMSPHAFQCFSTALGCSGCFLDKLNLRYTSPRMK